MAMEGMEVNGLARGQHLTTQEAGVTQLCIWRNPRGLLGSQVVMQDDRVELSMVFAEGIHQPRHHLV